MPFVTNKNSQKLVILLITLLFSVKCFAAEYFSPIDFFVFNFTFGFIFSSTVYLIVGSIVIFVNRYNDLEKSVIIIPLSIVLFGLFILFIMEAMVHNSGGLFGGSIIGGIIPSLIYYLIIQKINKTKSIGNDYTFNTKRLNIIETHSYISSLKGVDDFYERVVNIMSPEVTKDLPNEWQNVNSAQSARNWINKVLSESPIYVIQQDQCIIGFLFLYETPSDNHKIDLRLGYLFSKEHWGQGYGSEMIQGLLMHCRSDKKIHSISAGVNIDNKASIRVLEKYGFERTESQDVSSMMFEYVF